MVTVFFRNRTYNFHSYRDARQFERENPGACVATPQQSYEEPRQYQQPRRRSATPPQTPRKSIVPNMIGTYNPHSAKMFRPATAKRKLSEVND
ncbi:unnamed protein product [marine sediment metagenome]|uniref:Uncharacterized protein n=1 Tax=marine sediment metagenome TaxID=412755 RepID=X1BD84_9ZZZZ